MSQEPFHVAGFSVSGRVLDSPQVGLLMTLFIKCMEDF